MAPALPLHRDARFHRRLGLQVLQIPRDRCDSEGASPALIRHGAIPSTGISVDLDRIPMFGMPDIVNGDVVMLTPKEWNGIESFAITQNILCCRLPLTLSHHPVLYAYSLSR